MPISSVSAINLPEKKSGKSSYQNAALARAKALRDEGKNLGKIADALASEFNLKELDATSVKRILDCG